MTQVASLYLVTTRPLPLHPTPFPHLILPESGAIAGFFGAVVVPHTGMFPDTLLMEPRRIFQPPSWNATAVNLKRSAAVQNRWRDHRFEQEQPGTSLEYSRLDALAAKWEKPCKCAHAGRGA